MQRNYPDYVASDLERTVLEARYLHRDAAGKIIETPQGMIDRVANFLGTDDAEREQFREVMTRRRFLPNTPTLANAGRKNGQLAACFVLPVPDSISGIYDAIKYAALIHKTGGGTGFSFSRLREKGALVGSTGGIASGPISFMEVFDASTSKITQGGIRRGANMGVLRVDHPDILEFITCKQAACGACLEAGKKSCQHRITNFNISLGVTDAFMSALEKNEHYELVSPTSKQVVRTLDARTVWNLAVQNAWLCGDPGLIFLDRVNRLDPLAEALGDIEATNPCVSGDTLILTKQGQARIDSVVGKEVEVWNGEEWSKVTPCVTGTNQPMLRVELSNGLSLTCTLAHKWILSDGKRVQARELKEGTKLARFVASAPCESGAHVDHAYLAGVYQGDGYFNSEKKRKEINFYGAKITIADKLAASGEIKLGSYDGEQDRKRGILTVDVPAKGECPLDWDQQSSLAFLAGLLDTDGNVAFSDKNQNSYGYQISSIDRDFLISVSYLLRKLGEPSTVALMKDAEVKAMPGGVYLCQPAWRLSIPASSVVRLNALGLGKFLQRLHKGPNNPSREAARFPVVKSVTPCGVAPVVYCFTESARNSGVFNGILTGQCGEVPLRAFDACTLGSVNLAACITNGAFDANILAHTVRIGVRMLNRVIDCNHYPLPEIEHVVKQSRKIGLGVMGLADTLIACGLRYDSDAAREWAAKVAKWVAVYTHDESVSLGFKHGSFPAFSESKWNGKVEARRNSTTTVIAPTGSIAIIAGCSASIEPLYALAMTRNQVGKKLTDINDMFRRHSLVTYAASKLDAIRAHVEQYGTVGGCSVASQTTKDLFKCASEISPEDHIKMQAVWQKHVEDAVSKTVNMPNDATPADVDKVYSLAWQLGCKGVTVYRDGSRNTQVLVSGTSETPKEALAQDSKPAEPNPERVYLYPKRVHDGQLRSGVTATAQSAAGSVHVTCNSHPSDGEPFELWVTCGKAGSEVKAWSEALGRVASYALSLPSTESPKQRLMAIAEQLSGIGGQAAGFGPKRTASAPDAVSQAVKKCLGEQADPNDPSKKPGDICPECHAPELAQTAGCTLCHACGYSAC